MYNNPQNYFNGTAPLNVTGAVAECIEPLAGENGTTFCTIVNGTAADSYMWYVLYSFPSSVSAFLIHLRPRYDELHPSEQSDRNLARRMADAITRNESDTTWITWFS